ncbi:MAG: YHS domain-containing protein [Planctomycetota bacterium]|nr:YHS domain-containing protein [Planctomycetota bacterium]
MGTQDGDVLRMAFRNATYEPKHDFYHADCAFTFAPDGRSFDCLFWQQAEPLNEPDENLSPGRALGQLVAPPHAETAKYLERVRRMPGEAYRKAAGLAPEVPRCAVLPQRAADVHFSAVHEGKTYYFCCPSCKGLFESAPVKFLPSDAP